MEKKKGSKEYFTQETENAIVAYVSSVVTEERNMLYITHIKPAFDRLVDKIVFTYKYGHLSDLEFLKEDCKLYLLSILKNFDPSKGSKAFSYYTIVTKNWFSYKCKKQNKRRHTEVAIEELGYELHNENTIVFNKYVEIRSDKEFWFLLMKNISSWKTLYRGNDLKVLNAIEVLLSDVDNVEIFNKKAIYLYIRELTNLNTKQITNSLKKFKIRYGQFKSGWENS